MNENDLFNFQLEYTFTADWLAELDRQLAAEVTEKVSKFIPEVRVQEVTWTGGNTGKLFPKVVITSA